MRRRSLARIAAIALLFGSGPALAQRQAYEVQLAVPGIGQDVAHGMYFFKFAVIDRDGQVSYWSHDGSSVDGHEPATSLPLPVEYGRVTVLLGEPPFSGQPDLTSDILERGDAVLRVWVSNGHTSTFQLLPDRRLRGKGFAYLAERARNADRLDGRRADEFEVAGAVWRHEQDYVHGQTVATRHYQASSDVGAGRSLTVHFEVPHDEATVQLQLHAQPASGPPSIGDLRMRSARSANQPPGPPVDVVEVRASGWLAGLRETYDYCNTCFKRKLPPDTEVFIDGVAFDAWKADQQRVDDDAKQGRIDNLSLLGLVRFERSLKVVSTHRGVDVASGMTTVWYYTAAAADSVPGAVQVLLDDADITPALTASARRDGAVASVAHRLLAARHDGVVQLADALDPSPLLIRRPEETWLADLRKGLRLDVAAAGASLLAIGEIRLEAGPRVIAMAGSAPALLEVLTGGRYETAVRMVAAGSADATLTVAEAGWYPVRLVVSAPTGPLAVALTIDDAPPGLRTTPLLGGGGAGPWSTGPIDLSAAGINVGGGAHVLTLRNRSMSDGHLEYTVSVQAGAP